MKYFTNITSYEDLKAQYRTLAMIHHPDTGGNLEEMKVINNEYDQLFIIWKHRNNINNNETAASTRSEFYTQNGWKGENYNSKLSLKEIACLVREFIKIHYNECKFSVTTEYASMCQELHIYLMESPYRAYKSFNELTDDENQYDSEYNAVIRKYTQEKGINSWHKAELDNTIRPIYDKDFGKEAGVYLPKFLTDDIKEPVKAVEEYAKSFNYSDCDGMIDYFDVNFYFFGVQIGKWDKPYKIVERTKRNVPNVEYENVEVKKTRTYKTLEPKDIEAPTEFKQGQFFQLKNSFNYGCNRGYVYQIDHIYEGKLATVYAYKMGKGYKNVCRGDVRGNSFSCTKERLNEWINKGAICFVDLVEVTKKEEYTSVVRRPKKQTGISTEVRATTDTENTPQNTPEAAGAKEYTITSDTDTRDNSALWVVKFIDRMDRDDYKQTAEIMKSIKGYWSKFKGGFIFRYDPAEKLSELYNTIKQEQTTTHNEQDEETARETAEKLIDTSTNLIVEFRLRPGEYLYNSKYKNQMRDYIIANKEQITKSVIDKINIKELRILIEKVLEEQEKGAA
jgi:hypothetical protein